MVLKMLFPSCMRSNSKKIKNKSRKNRIGVYVIAVHVKLYHPSLLVNCAEIFATEQQIHSIFPFFAFILEMDSGIDV